MAKPIIAGRLPPGRAARHLRVQRCLLGFGTEEGREDRGGRWACVLGFGAERRRGDWGVGLRWRRLEERYDRGT